MRQPIDWSERDLLLLIRNQVTESLTLDYKASAALKKTDSKKRELSKDVSAFANSAGGQLIYGIREEGHLPKQIDDGLLPDEISKEWIEQVINSTIARRIDGVHIRQIPLSGERTGRVAYVVDVPSSPGAPHMAADRRYYKRFNFESVPMEEYEVRDVSRRFIAPNLALKVVPSDRIQPHQLPYFAKLSVYVENTSPASADFAFVAFHVSAGYFQDVQGPTEVAQTAVTFGRSLVPVHSYKVEWRGSLRLPLMQGARYHIADLTVLVSETAEPAHLFWEVLAPNADPKRGCIEVQRGPERLWIAHVIEEWHVVEEIVWRV